jgi:hypothetical protein
MDSREYKTSGILCGCGNQMVQRLGELPVCQQCGAVFEEDSLLEVLSSKQPYHSDTLQEFLELPYVNPFPVWPADKPIQPLYFLPPVESEYLLPENPEEWSSTVVTDGQGTLYIFAEGQWWQYPRVVTTEDWNFGARREFEYLSVKAKELEEALRGIIEIGKRDTTNPKYDPFYDYAREVLEKY